MDTHIPDDDLYMAVESFCADFFPGDREGRCFDIVFPLSGHLRELFPSLYIVDGIVPVNGINHHHYWIKLPDGRIVDPTARQFNCKFPESYIGACPKNYIEMRRI